LYFCSKIKNDLLRKFIAYLLAGIAFLFYTGLCFYSGIQILEKQQVVAENSKTAPTHKSAEYSLSAPISIGYIDFSRFSENVPQNTSRTLVSSGSDNRISIKTRLDLNLFQEFRTRYTRKLTSGFIDGYYIYHLCKMLI